MNGMVIKVRALGIIISAGVAGRKVEGAWSWYVFYAWKSMSDVILPRSKAVG